MIVAGKMDRKATIQVSTRTTGAQGGFTEAWSTLAEIWVQYMPRGSRDFWAAGMRHSEATAAFRTRYRSDITGQHRILFEGKLWSIIGEPLEEGRREGLLIAAKYVEGVTP